VGRLLRDASIRTKVLTLVIIVAGVALVLASAALLTSDYYQYRTDIRQNLAMQARMVLENSTAAMSFLDPVAAQETLATLSPNPHIHVGCLYNAGGSLFARFTPDGSSEAQCPVSPPAEEYRYQSNRVHVVARTSVAGRPAGSVYLESDLEAVTDRARVQVLTATGILGIAMVVALLLTSTLRRVISEPIDALGETARLVTTRQDYSLRARKTTGDELGLLVDAFNAMLSQIERAEQERTLLLAREREANRLKDDFLMTLSHELRTPLNAIQGWTRMLITHVIPTEGVGRALEKIERNAQAQSRLVEDLLEVSRFTTGKFRLGRLPIDLVTIINQAIETSRPDAESRGITIERQFDLASAPLTGDPDRLQQVVWNLLSNAVKFSRCSSACARTETTTNCASPTTASASARRSCRTCSSPSARPMPRPRGRTAAWVSVSRSCGASSICTADASKPRAKASGRAPRSPSGYRLRATRRRPRHRAEDSIDTRIRMISQA
jgi:two-component system, sensor histidine kinase